MTHFARFGALALLLALGAPLPAQYTTGRLQGAIADESGMPLPGAAVHLLNLATNAERTVTSTDSGAYFFAARAARRLPSAGVEGRIRHRDHGAGDFHQRDAHARPAAAHRRAADLGGSDGRDRGA